MRIARLPIPGFILALSILTSACAPADPATTVSPQNVGAAAMVTGGTVMEMTPVRIAGTRTGLGAGMGMFSGSLIGSTIGGDWRARTVAAVAGGLIGGFTGAAVEQGVTSGQGVRFLIRLDSGQAMETVQPGDFGLRPGDRVAVSMGDRVRLSPMAPLQAAPYGRRAVN